MYLIDTMTGKTMEQTALAPYPFGAAFDTKLVAQAAKMEVHGSSFDDPGDDFNLFRLFDAEGVLIAERKMMGY